MSCSSATSTRPDLSERAQRLLKILIERYIRDGQPVGSRTLSQDRRLDLSPATIRNVMADLEDVGLLKSPHTSAGRVPTVQGYRLFVDSLLTVQSLEELEVQSLETQLSPSTTPEGVLESASSLLSELTKMAGVVVLPRRETLTLRQVEFLPLSEKRVLVILVLNEKEVQNRIIHTSRRYSAAELQRAGNYLSREFAGRDLEEVRAALIREMQETRENMNRLMATAIEVAQKAFSREDEKDDNRFVLSGETNLMGYAEMADVERLRSLFDAFNNKRDILHLLDQCLNGKGIQIFIGEESGYQALDECSVVTAPYGAGGRSVGVLGVIGPTRMAYDRVIPIVDITARLLGAALNQLQ